MKRSNLPEDVSQASNVLSVYQTTDTFATWRDIGAKYTSTPMLRSGAGNGECTHEPQSTCAESPPSDTVMSSQTYDLLG